MNSIEFSINIAEISSLFALETACYLKSLRKFLNWIMKKRWEKTWEKVAGQPPSRTKNLFVENQVKQLASVAFFFTKLGNIFAK